MFFKSRKQLDLIFAKYMDKNDAITRDILHEPNKENTNSANSFKIIDNYFRFCKRSIFDENKFTFLREQQIYSEKETSKRNSFKNILNTLIKVLTYFKTLANLANKNHHLVQLIRFYF